MFLSRLGHCHVLPVACLPGCQSSSVKGAVLRCNCALLPPNDRMSAVKHRFLWGRAATAAGSCCTYRAGWLADLDSSVQPVGSMWGGHVHPLTHMMVETCAALWWHLAGAPDPHQQSSTNCTTENTSTCIWCGVVAMGSSFVLAYTSLGCVCRLSIYLLLQFDDG